MLHQKQHKKCAFNRVFLYIQFPYKNTLKKFKLKMQPQKSLFNLIFYSKNIFPSSHLARAMLTQEARHICSMHSQILVLWNENQTARALTFFYSSSISVSLFMWSAIKRHVDLVHFWRLSALYCCIYFILFSSRWVIILWCVMMKGFLFLRKLRRS